MKQDRVIIQDPLFGPLSYHKRFVNNTDFDGSKHLCNLPFRYAEVRRDGDVHMCCPNWSPVVVGNVFESSMTQIWQGERAQAQRRSILDGSYRYCNWDTCSLIRNNRLEQRTEASVAQLVKRAESCTPETVHFVVDESCNLSCPSCRMQRLAQLAPAERDRGYQAITRVLDCMFAEPHAEHKTLSMDGSGEIFSSELYRRLFETHAVFNRSDLWPNLRFRLTTNGTMMTAKIQRRYVHIMNRLEQLEVSVDAGDPESYAKVRVGGRWDLLWENLRCFHDSILVRQPHTTWRWNIIMQKNNYKSLPDLINIANTFERKPMINMTAVLNWGTWTEEEYLDHAVHLPQHPKHKKYTKIMNSPLVQEYRNNYGI